MTRLRRSDRFGITLLMLGPVLFLLFGAVDMPEWAASHGSAGSTVFIFLNTLAICVACYGG